MIDWLKGLFKSKPTVVVAAPAPGAYVDSFDDHDHAYFFKRVRIAFGPLRQAQVDGMLTILSEWNLRGAQDVRWLAYMFATVWHETAATMQPVTEYGSQAYLRAKKYWPYIGRGLVQLTWKENYAKYGIEKTPERALEPGLAAHILFDGMTKGVFTGRRLNQYFNGATDDPLNARRIINGTDKAQLIVQHYKHFLVALRPAEQTKT